MLIKLFEHVNITLLSLFVVQLQLEENFFHNHPASMKRIVDFVAERTASNFIKKFRSAALQKSIASCRIALQKLMESYASSSPSSKAKVNCRKY